MEYRFVNHSLFTENGIRDLKNGGVLGKVIIYPFGEEGKIVKGILNLYFNIQEYAIVDNLLSKKYDGIKSLEELTNMDIENATVLIASDRPDIWDEIREALYKYVPKRQCVELFPHPGSGLGVLSKNYSSEIKAALFEEAFRETVKYIRMFMLTARPFTDLPSLWEYLLCHETLIDGMLMEFGVFNGRSINYFSTLKPGHTIYGFDSFEGLPEDWGPGAGYSSAFKGACDRQGNMPDVNSNVVLVKGWFENSLPQFLDRYKGVCSFIHIDCDIYSSTHNVLYALKDRIIPGTVILFDEYFNYPGWEQHEYKAFQEFIKDTGKGYEYIGYNERGVQVAVRIIK